jgi:hypothetical protein
MINLFQSDADPEVFGFTRDPTGQNLPARFAPWRKASHAGSLYLGTGESSAELGAKDPVIRAVQTKGYYLVETRTIQPLERWKRSMRYPD